MDDQTSSPALPSTHLSEHVGLAHVATELDTAQQQLKLITEQLQARTDEIALLKSTLLQERQNYREVFDAALAPYLVTDLLGQVLNVNMRAAALLDLDVSFIVGKMLAEFIHREHRQALRGVLCDPTLCTRVVSFEWRVERRRSHEMVQTCISVGRAQTGGSDVLHWMFRAIESPEARVRDTKPPDPRRGPVSTPGLLSQTEASFDREHAARRVAEQQLRERDDFLASAAHELHDPLGALAGWLVLLDGNRNDGSMRDRAFAGMYHSVHLLTRMVEDLVGKARSAEGVLSLERQSVQLSQIVHASLQEHRPAARLKQVHLVASLDDQLPQILGDARRLQQVVDNLIRNALEFTPRTGSVVVLLVRVGEQAELSIRDTGHGIAPEALTKIFEPFVQLHTTGANRLPGMRLGLYIARRLVEQHGGTVSAESMGEGHGSTFRVRLPL
jgi:signal transduction histidine kinase